MRFYTRTHKHYCGIDLHARSMYLCILDAQGEILLHRNFKAEPQAFLSAVAPYREDLVVAVECIFTWYWLADLCAEEGIAFVLGHALYMKAIHGGKAKNDRIDAHKIARRHAAAGVCIPESDARHAGPAAPAQSPDEKTRGAARAYPQHRKPVQPAAARHPGRPQSRARDDPRAFPRWGRPSRGRA